MSLFFPNNETRMAYYVRRVEVLPPSIVPTGEFIIIFMETVTCYECILCSQQQVASAEHVTHTVYRASIEASCSHCTNDVCFL